MVTRYVAITALTMCWTAGPHHNMFYAVARHVLLCSAYVVHQDFYVLCVGRVSLSLFFSLSSSFQMDTAANTGVGGWIGVGGEN